MIIKRIDYLSAGKVVGLLYAAIGLISGLFVTLASLMLGSAAFIHKQGYMMGGYMMGSVPGVPVAPGLAVFAFIIWPILYGITGFVSAVVFAFLYNLIAVWAGGIEVEVAQQKKGR